MDDKKKKIIVVIVLILLAIIALILFLSRRTPTYQITFDSNGGSLVDSQEVKKGETVTKPEDPTKEGYEFVGWYYEDELYSFDTEVSKDMVLKAAWGEELKGIILDSSNVSLVINDNKKLQVTSLPNGVSENDLIWESSDSEIVSVDSKGNLKALKAGTVTITVKSKNGDYTTTCTVTVTDKKVEVESVKISGQSEVTVGKTIKLTVKINPDNATNKEVTWKSSNTSVATVDKNGNVKGIKAGTVTITVTTSDGSKTATYKVTVKASSSESSGNSGTSTKPQTQQPEEKPKNVPVTGVSITTKPTDIKVGNTYQLNATVSPTNATNKGVKWSSSNPSVATVDQNGKLVGVDDGEAVITVTTEDGSKTDSYTVHVSSTYEIHLKKISLTEDKAAQYTKTVYKNGKEFTGYEFITIGNGRVAPAENVMASFTNNGTLTTARIRINGKSYDATIKYN